MFRASIIFERFRNCCTKRMFDYRRRSFYVGACVSRDQKFHFEVKRTVRALAPDVVRMAARHDVVLY